ncbi:ribonuclease H-like domain-containing protein [Patescibacteria group bacterium]|nr:ribonuclease H-like domain-containing protein [Patescibacteria group bacterium]
MDGKPQLSGLATLQTGNRTPPLARGGVILFYPCDTFSVITMRREIVLDIETQNTFQDVGSYNAALLKISLIGVYFYETDTFETFLEADFPKLWPRLERADRVIGYNLFGFDYPCMQTYYSGDFRKIPTVDLMLEIEKRIGFKVKLDDVAHATLGVGKSGHGLQAVEFWKNGEIEKLADYCLQDVRITRDVYEHALQNQEVFYTSRQGQKMNVAMPIQPPQEDQKVPMNLSLGL